MLSPKDIEQRNNANVASGTSSSLGLVSQEFMPTNRGIMPGSSIPGMPQGVPQLVLHNESLDIRIVGVNGAVIGRRQGPYAQHFQQNMYVSGVHAQLKYNSGTGWCVTDKHSSNGTRLNDHQLQPDVEMSLKNGDILTIANVNLQVNIS
jgi:pSer/pThr/pTyr-binding forkhead associated (FHA) protein